MYPSQRSNEEGQSQSEQIILDYHPAAIDELIDAARFYESRQTDLGYRFLDAIDVALEAIQKNPLMWCADKMGRRKYYIKNFHISLCTK